MVYDHARLAASTKLIVNCVTIQSEVSNLFSTNKEKKKNSLLVKVESIVISLLVADYNISIGEYSLALTCFSFISNPNSFQLCEFCLMRYKI